MVPAAVSSTVLIFDGATQIGTTTAASTGTGAWSFTPTTALSEGAHSITAKARDAAGNTSPASTAISITIDTTPPAAPAITSPATGTTTNNNMPPISGTAAVSSTVLIFDGATQIGTATAASTGTGAWSFTPTTALSEGAHSITAKARDAAGNTSPASTAISITINTAASSTTFHYITGYWHYYKQQQAYSIRNSSAIFNSLNIRWCYPDWYYYGSIYRYWRMVIYSNYGLD